MKITFEEIEEKQHFIAGAFLFYRLPNGLYKRYLIIGIDKDSEVITIRAKS